MPVVTFNTSEGHSVTFSGTSSLGMFGPQIGESVPVRYYARDPEQARVATFRGSFLFLVVALAVGAALATGSALAVRDATETIAPAQIRVDRRADYVPLRRSATELDRCLRARCAGRWEQVTDAFSRAATDAVRAGASSSLVKRRTMELERALVGFFEREATIGEGLFDVRHAIAALRKQIAIELRRDRAAAAAAGPG